jgi:hypothetical protein
MPHGQQTRKKGAAATGVSNAVRRAKGKSTKRAARHSNVAVRSFLNDNPRGLYLAKVIKLQGNHLTVQKADGEQETVRIAGKLALPRGIHHKQNVTTAHADNYVLVDGGDAVAMVETKNVHNLKRHAGWNDRSGKSSLFNRSRSGSRSVSVSGL